jgi:hypothetical protein
LPYGVCNPVRIFMWDYRSVCISLRQLAGNNIPRIAHAFAFAPDSRRVITPNKNRIRFMKLEAISEVIFRGLKILENHLHTFNKVSDDSILYLTPEIMVNGEIINKKAQFITQKKYQKFYGNKPLKSFLLFYGDFICCPEKKCSCFIRDERSKILPSDKVIVIRPYAYLNSFLLKKSRLKYLEEEIHKAFKTDSDYKRIFIPDTLGDDTDDILGEVRPDKKQIDRTQININQGVMTLDKILKRMNLDEIDLNVENYFQRKSGLWTNNIKSRFIEALIVKQPVPAFYFDATNDNKWLIVDGLQRLTAVKKYVVDQSFRLSGLFYLSEEFEGKFFDDLPRSAQRSIEEYEVIAYRILSPTPKEVKLKIFRSINTSALILTKQEIRHALNQGNASKWVAEIAEMPIFKKVVPLSEKQIERMEDRELALRYLAFRITHYQDFRYSIHDFLDESMTKLLLKVDEEDFKKYKSQLEKALSVINIIFESAAFTKMMFGIDNENFINHIFEVTTYIFSKLSDIQHLKLIYKKEEVRSRIKKLKNNKEFERSIQSNSPYTKEAIRIRFATLLNFFEEL